MEMYLEHDAVSVPEHAKWEDDMDAQFRGMQRMSQPLLQATLSWAALRGLAYHPSLLMGKATLKGWAEPLTWPHHGNSGHSKHWRLLLEVGRGTPEA